MSRTLKEFSKVGRNKHTRQLLAKQKQLRRGKYSNVKSMKMSKDAKRPMPYMHERNEKGMLT